jgi:hypothetical protein
MSDDCSYCGGHGLVGDYGMGDDFYGAKECNECEGTGMMKFDLISHLTRQKDFSFETFGPGPRTQGVIDHIRKELKEIEANPKDLKEWVDVILLALDGAWRAGYDPVQIAAMIDEIQTRNENRKWPDWRTADPNKAIEHDRTGE